MCLYLTRDFVFGRVRPLFSHRIKWKRRCCFCTFSSFILRAILSGGIQCGEGMAKRKRGIIMVMTSYVLAQSDTFSSPQPKTGTGLCLFSDFWSRVGISPKKIKQESQHLSLPRIKSSSSRGFKFSKNISANRFPHVRTPCIFSLHLPNSLRFFSWNNINPNVGNLIREAEAEGLFLPFD